MKELLEKFPTADAFWEGLNGEYSATGLVKALAADFGVHAQRLAKKRDTFDAAYLLLQDAAAAESQMSPEPPGETAPEPGAKGVLPPVEAPGSAVRYQVRSRQSQGRWRAGRHWQSAWVILSALELTPGEWDELRSDPQIEVRELI